jgi:hypothetical protein
MPEDDSIRSYVLYVFIMVLIILAIIIFIELTNIDLNPAQPNKKIVQVVTIEALNNNNTNTNTNIGSKDSDTSFVMNPAVDFCKSHTGSSDKLKESCAKLTNKNCNATSCCIMLNGEKCVPGSEDGPTFRTTPSGENVNIDYYYFQNKCYGNKCS